MFFFCGFGFVTIGGTVTCSTNYDRSIEFTLSLPLIKTSLFDSSITYPTSGRQSPPSDGHQPANQPIEHQDEIKGLFKKLKEVKVDRKCDAFIGVQVPIWLAACGECRIAKTHVMAGVTQHLLLNSPGCGEKVDRLLPLGG